jgi:predicted dinucleotide-binding enzyme
MNIAVIGKGKVGLGLARTFSGAGHTVWLGVRGAVVAVDGIEARAVAEAVEGADLVVLAVPAAALDAVVEVLGPLDGVVVVDATNPLRWEGGPVHAPPPEGSNAARLQSLRPAARVVKAWNTFGAEFMARPSVAGAPLTLLFATDDALARQRVAELARSAGFSPVDSGPLRNAALLEQQAVLWIHLAMVGDQGRAFAFQIAREG